MAKGVFQVGQVSFMILNILEITLYLFIVIRSLIVYKKIDNRLDRVFREKKELISKFRGYHISLIQAIITVSFMYICGVSMWFYDRYITKTASSATAEELVWFIIEASVGIVFLFTLDVVNCANMSWADVSTMRLLKFRFSGKEESHSVMCSVPDEITEHEHFAPDKTLILEHKKAHTENTGEIGNV